MEGKEWCAAAELEDGDVLHTQNGETEIVADVWTEWLDEAVKVYNLEIAILTTYDNIYKNGIDIDAWIQDLIHTVGTKIERTKF